jgi:D-3-phosphoglycerate dehydrogenase
VTLASRVDVLTLHVPLSSETRGMIGAEVLEALSPGILLNTSRADVVDTDALMARLDEGGLSAGLDVFPDEPGSGPADWRSPLASHPRVVGTHHVGASTQQAQEAVVDGVQDVIDAFSEGELLNVVNAPAQHPSSQVAQSGAELLDYHGSGMSLIEMSHRSPEYDAVPWQFPTSSSCCSSRAVRCCSSRWCR